MARSHEILSRKDEYALSYKDRFELNDGLWADAGVILGDGVFMPYAIDAVSREFIFSDTPPEIDLTSFAFVSNAQFANTRRLVALSFDEVERILPALPEPSPLIIIANPARSGSTLLQHILTR